MAPPRMVSELVGPTAAESTGCTLVAIVIEQSLDVSATLWQRPAPQGDSAPGYQTTRLMMLPMAWNVSANNAYRGLRRIPVQRKRQRRWLSAVVTAAIAMVTAVGSMTTNSTAAASSAHAGVAGLSSPQTAATVTPW